ncbi:MAG: cation transporter [Treponema sp.]|nr:cation transporter [Treponema sp.]
MGTVFIIVILLLAAAFAIKSVVHRIRHGSSCCGERDVPEKKIRPKDKNKSNYSHKYILTVDGMHCSNCARHVENALNSSEGIWASVNLEKKAVSVLSKHELDDNFLRSKINDAGYTVLEIKGLSK